MIIVSRGYGLLVVIAGTVLGLLSLSALAHLGVGPSLWGRLLAAVIAFGAMVGLEQKLNRTSAPHDVFWLPIPLWGLAVGALIIRG